MRWLLVLLFGATLFGQGPTTPAQDDEPVGWQETARNASSALPASTPLESPNLITPIAVVLLAPVALAFLVRRNLSSDRKLNRMVWMNWSTVAVWLYWISVLNPARLADYIERALPLPSAVTIGLGVLFYTLPPLLSMAGCLIAMAPLLSSSGESFKLLVLRSLTAQASFQIPF